MILDRSKRVLILAGAGFSMGFFNGQLKTESLTNYLNDESCWKTVYDKWRIHRNGRSSTILDHLDFKDAIRLLKRTNKVLKGSHVYRNRIDFENTIHILDKVSTYLSSTGLFLKNPDPHDLDALLIHFLSKNARKIQSFEKASHPHGFRYVPYLSREVIASAILNIWERGSHNPSLVAAETFLRNCVKNAKLCLYSLNYDPLILEASRNLKEIATGFTNGIFNPQLFLRADNVLSFPHGHIGFRKGGENMELFFNYRDAQDKRMRDSIDDSGSIFHFRMAGIGYNTFLVSGLDKFDSFRGEPYSTYFFRFGADLEKADLIIIIGYGFRDEHFNIILSNALKAYSKKLIIIDKNSKVKKLFDDLSSNYLEPSVSLQPLILFKESLFESDESTINSDLLTKQYARIGRNSVYYNKGIIDFMKDYQAIIQML